MPDAYPSWPLELGRFALILARIVPLVFLAPFLGGRAVPAPLRATLGVAIATLAGPYVSSGPHAVHASMASHRWLIAGLAELGLGLTMGLIAVVPFWAARSAGSILDLVGGPNQVELHFPGMGRTSPLGQLYHQLTLLCFVHLDGPARILSTLLVSFDRFRLGAPCDPAPELGFGIGEVLLVYGADVSKLAVALVLPGLFAALFVDIVFGCLSRAAPALNAYFAGLGAKALVVLGVVALTLPSIGWTAWMMQSKLLLLTDALLVRPK